MSELQKAEAALLAVDWSNRSALEEAASRYVMVVASEGDTGWRCEMKGDGRFLVKTRKPGGPAIDVRCEPAYPPHSFYSARHGNPFTSVKVVIELLDWKLRKSRLQLKRSDDETKIVFNGALFLRRLEDAAAANSAFIKQQQDNAQLKSDQEAFDRKHSSIIERIQSHQPYHRPYCDVRSGTIKGTLELTPEQWQTVLEALSPAD